MVLPHEAVNAFVLSYTRIFCLLQIQCHYILLGDGNSRILTNSSIKPYIVNGNNGITCSRNSMTFRLNSEMEMPKFFDCLLSEQTEVLEANSDAVIIRSHCE